MRTSDSLLTRFREPGGARAAVLATKILAALYVLANQGGRGELPYQWTKYDRQPSRHPSDELPSSSGMNWSCRELRSADHACVQDWEPVLRGLRGLCGCVRIPNFVVQFYVSSPSPKPLYGTIEPLYGRWKGQSQSRKTSHGGHTPAASETRNKHDHLCYIVCRRLQLTCHTDPVTRTKAGQAWRNQPESHSAKGGTGPI
ncbi:hypothetical protein VTK73DRAFT_9385 [Phialemonium thermophilum]|uniref:Uncharacterized protein n=1 Tax=Phialemonium thermophilum TaxID=223376 RepID=A0ABR3W3A1_9PEZI